jgi:hypothetical protein
MKKINRSLIVAMPFLFILLKTELSYCQELDQNDLQYQFKVLPMIIAATNHFNDVATRIIELIEYPNADLAIELCKQSRNSYKTIGRLGENIASVKPGVVYLRYSQLLSQLFAVRKAMLLLLMQSCASDPLFEKPDVWNSFKIRSIQLEEQISQVSSRLEQELNKIDKSFQNEQ